MSNKVTPDSFRASMDRCLSGTKADPFLASRIIASEKGEPKMKRAPLRIALVLLVLIILATVAYAATQMLRNVNWKGETIEEYPEDNSNWMADFKASAGISPDEAWEMVDKLVAGFPDEDDITIRYTAPDGQTMAAGHPKQKCFTSFEEFKAFMTDYDYLTVPAWLPDSITGFNAAVHMDISPALSRNDIKVEEYEDGPLYYRHFTYDNSRAVVTGYQIELYIGKSNTWITSRIGKDLRPESGLRDTAAIEVVNIKGMDDSLLTFHPEISLFTLQAHRKLGSIVRYKRIDTSIPVRSDEEVIFVQSSVLDKDAILRIFNGE